MSQMTRDTHGMPKKEVHTCDTDGTEGEFNAGTGSAIAATASESSPRCLTMMPRAGSWDRHCPRRIV